MTIPVPSLQAGFTGVKDAKFVVPTASYKRENLTTKMPMLGFIEEAKIYKPPILNPTTDVSTARRVLMCRNDLRVKVGRRAKEERTIKFSIEGIGRNTKSFFPRPINNRPILVPTNSQDASKRNKLGLPR